MNIGDLHELPTLIRFATTIRGRVLLWALATGLLASSSIVWTISPLLALFLVQPTWRRELLCVGSVAFLYDRVASQPSLRDAPFHVAVMLGALVLVYLTYRAARGFRSLPQRVQRHPLIALHLLAWPLLGAVWFVPLHLDEPWRGVLRQGRWIVPFLLWRLGYLMLAGKRGSVRGSTFRDHLWYCLPCFGGTNVPFGKGSDYLNAQRADAAIDIARVQLAGIKLLVLSKLWFLLQVELAAVLFGGRAGWLGRLLDGNSLGLRRLEQLIATDASVAASWTGLFVELVYYTIGFAAFGHLIVGCLRLFGFGVFRNTYKPLLAETIVEFWNRFYYYFKELLVEFFFFPVFASYFKNSPRLRMFAAVMAAAFLGNVYYHVVRDLGVLGRVEPLAAVELVAPRVLYAFLLGLGVFVSMQRQQKRRGSPPVEGRRRTLRRIRNIAAVWFFFAVIHIWNVEPMELSLGERTRFFLGLFGL